MEVTGADTAVSSFSMLELWVHGEDIVYVFLFNGTRFYVSITSEKLEGEGELLQKFNDFKDDLDDPDTMFNFEEWVLGTLDDFMQKVAPTPAPGARKPITLLEYFSPPTFAFELVNKEGKLCAIREDYDPQIHGDTSPRTQIVEDSLPRSGRKGSRSSSAGDLLPGQCIQSRGAIPRSALPPVPLIPASHLERVDDGLRDEDLSDTPRKVRRVGTAEVFFFKPGFKDHGHLREIDLLSQIDRSGEFDPPFRTSRLAGLVVWGDGDDDDDASLMGLLLEYIEGDTLAERMEAVSVATRLKWFRQVQATVGRLHELGIVWGDVKPDNIMINAEGEAVVIDFGGGYTPEYIKPELQQTLQGDLMGLDHIADVIGVRCKSN
ncbi:hypothetical protein QBC46DRAFT_104501 [Diplogelasinospora grovesii]|uniref:Protein kinase domain-containing protein n=1 Tax=Diplogelasinospora grovesii TaxID=303347 RepID=A0AAN6NCR2_9PEZI|nr:hypothetical protein QBC46DRAFT_104501 [Diplogelasinospora grovesii]